MAAVKVTKPVEEVDGDDAMPEWKRLSIERSLQGPRARAQERTDRFVGAAMELMAERGSIEFTVQDVVDRSKMSIRTFYNFFASKDDLLVAVHETILATEVVPRMRAKCEALSRPHCAGQGLRPGDLRADVESRARVTGTHDLQQPASRDPARGPGTSLQAADRPRGRAHPGRQGVRPPASLPQHGGGGTSLAPHRSGDRPRADPRG